MPLGFRRIYLTHGLNYVTLNERGKIKIDPNVMIFFQEDNGSMTEIGTLNQLKDLSMGTEEIQSIQGTNLGKIRDLSDKLYIKRNYMSEIEELNDFHRNDINRPSQINPKKNNEQLSLHEPLSLHELAWNAATRNLPKATTVETEFMMAHKKQKNGGKRKTRKQHKKNKKTKNNRKHRKTSKNNKTKNNKTGVLNVQRCNIK